MAQHPTLHVYFAYNEHRFKKLLLLKDRDPNGNLRSQVLTHLQALDGISTPRDAVQSIEVRIGNVQDRVVEIRMIWKSEMSSELVTQAINTVCAKIGKGGDKTMRQHKLTSVSFRLASNRTLGAYQYGTSGRKDIGVQSREKKHRKRRRSNSGIEPVLDDIEDRTLSGATAKRARKIGGHPPVADATGSLHDHDRESEANKLDDAKISYLEERLAEKEHRSDKYESRCWKLEDKLEDAAQEYDDLLAELDAEKDEVHTLSRELRTREKALDELTAVNARLSAELAEMHRKEPSVQDAAARGTGSLKMEEPPLVPLSHTPCQCSQLRAELKHAASGKDMLAAELITIRQIAHHLLAALEGATRPPEHTPCSDDDLYEDVDPEPRSNVQVMGILRDHVLRLLAEEPPELSVLRSEVDAAKAATEKALRSKEKHKNAAKDARLSVQDAERRYEEARIVVDDATNWRTAVEKSVGDGQARISEVEAAVKVMNE